MLALSPFDFTVWASAVGFALILLDAFAIVRAISRDHGVDRTLAWIFAILALPGVGALAYLALASPSVSRTSSRKSRSAAAARTALARDLRHEVLVPAKDQALFALATRVTGHLPTTGNRVELLAENEAAFERIEEVLGRARRRIWAEFYIVRNDLTGRHFLELLAERARAGVEVRFIYDAVGSLRISSDRLQAIRDAGGEVVSFLPMNPLRRRWAVHLRNHRKLIVVDDSIAFTGGMNVGDEYSGRGRRRGLQRFHDTHLEIEGPAAGSLGSTFAEDWAFATEQPLAAEFEPQPVAGGSALVAALPSGPDQAFNAIQVTYTTAIARANERVYLCSPYFVPDASLQHALATAALRGVDVRVMIPERCDVRLIDAVARSYCRALLPAGVRVFRYLPAMLHAKTLLVDDDLGLVGSANADIRSFQLNFELGALVCDRDFALDLERSFASDLEQSREWTQADADRLTPLRRLLDSAARLLSPLL